MVLSEDYTPKYTVAQSRLIPLSLAAVRGGIGGFSHPPSGNSRWDLSRIREKVAYLPPGRGPGRDPGSGPRRTASSSPPRRDPEPGLLRHLKICWFPEAFRRSSSHPSRLTP